ncbi:hypothetical protein [Nonomuraea turcica]|uniref:hypothetical protein n=1 Tax=Nonomuraea sp. G32 TaxID=3067274 RepID=UPI00273C589A|nr:hypothetical protein [Nonomuraea sp. G32]MDP4511883.1 hypothetical protein [Nonomuraea sp. G32]
MIAWLGPADFPQHRRDTLLRRLAWEAGTDGPAALAELVAVRAAQPCRVPAGSAALTAAVAVLGDDGRYHLRLGTRYLCAQTWRGRKKPPPPALPHCRLQITLSVSACCCRCSCPCSA